MATEFNKQAFFTTVVTRWAATGFARAMEGDACRYRTDDGKRCVIGHGIPDAFYRPEFEGNDVGGLLAEMADEEKEATFGTADLTKDDLEFLYQLQDAHDNSGFLEGPVRDSEVESLLRDLAQRHDLEFPPL